MPDEVRWAYACEISARAALAVRFYFDGDILGLGTLSRPCPPVIYEGPDPGSGKARHRWHAAGATQKDAQRLLAELVKKSHDGDYRTPDRQALVIVAYKPQLSDVKTGQGRRTIDLEPKTVAVLRAWKKRQMEEQVLTNVRPDTDRMFAHPDGSCLNPDYFSQVFDRHLAKSALQRFAT